MNNSSPSIVLFGDSITQFSNSLVDEGWGILLSEAYSRKADIINRGYSGFNTKWALHLLPQIFTDNAFPSVKFITLWFGANDASLVHLNKRQHIPLDKYEANLHTIISHLLNLKTNATSTGHPYIILFTPPPVEEATWLKTVNERYNGKDTEANRSNMQTKLYAECAVKVAKKVAESHANCFSIDIWTEMQANPNWKEYLNDGLHLSKKGNRLVYDKLMQLIKAKIPECHVDKIPMQIVDHKEVDRKNLEECLKLKPSLA